MRKLFYLTLFTCALLTTTNSCKKEKKTTPAVPPAGAIQIWNNVHIIDSTQWILYEGNGSPENGFYYYTFTPNTPNIPVINVGDILIGDAYGGYIRTVLGTKLSGGSYVISTSPATMNDVFKSGTFSLQIPINDSSQQNSGVTRSFTNLALYQKSNFELELFSGQFNFQPTCNFTFSFDSLGLTNFQMSTTNSPFSANITAGVKGDMPYSWNNSLVLNTYTVNSIQHVTAWTSNGNVQVPVVFKLLLSLLANTTGGSQSYDTVNTRFSWSTNDIYSAGLQYTNNAWQPTYSSLATNVAALDTFSQARGSDANISFSEQISSMLYSVAGPQLTIGMSGNLDQSQPYGTGYPFLRRTSCWNSATTSQLRYPVFGKLLSSFTQSWSSDTVIYQAPYQITKIAGDNQTDNVVNTLPLPLVIKVTDSNGQPTAKLPVTFTVTHGGGTISATKLLTDQNGLAQVSWTLGPAFGNQNVTVTAVDGNNHPLIGSPLLFNATGQ